MLKSKTNTTRIKEMEERIEDGKLEIKSIESTIRNQKLMITRLEKELAWAKKGDDSWL